MMLFETTTSIAATPDRVWATLLQTERWPDWGAGIERVEGRLGPDQRLTLHVADASRPVRLRVTEWRPQRVVELRGGLPLGLFVGTRTYRLTPVDGGTEFHMREAFSGPLAGPIGRTIPDLQPSFDAFAAGLRRAAQASTEPAEGPSEGENRG